MNSALHKATQNASTANYKAIFEGFMGKGLEPEDIRPRENVFTYRAWRELGRQVRKGEKGVRVVTYVEAKKKTKSGKEGKPFRFPKSTTVFHISQTDGAKEGAAPIPMVTQAQAPTSKPKAINGDKFRAMAEKMQKAIDGKMADKLTNTAKRVAQAAHSRLEGEKLKRTQAALYALADMQDRGEVPPELACIRTKANVYGCMGEKSESIENGYHSYHVGTGEPSQSDEVTAALWGLLAGKTEEEKRKEVLDRKVEGLQFSQIPGYFPTPQTVIDVMLDYACIESDHRVLEPNLGSCSIADAVAPVCAEVKGFEINCTLAEIADAKDYLIECRDFLTVEWEEITSYERVLMNPPFEKLQDIDHVRHAFQFLKPGGRLVSVVSSGAIHNTTKKADEFQSWLYSMGAEFFPLPDGSFKESGTLVTTYLVIIDKP